MGTFLERADNTARLLDVKYHAAYNDKTSDAASMEEDYDFYQWSAILAQRERLSRCTARSTAM